MIAFSMSYYTSYYIKLYNSKYYYKWKFDLDVSEAFFMQRKFEKWSSNYLNISSITNKSYSLNLLFCWLDPWYIQPTRKANVSVYF